MRFLYIYPDVHIWYDNHQLLFFDTRSQIQKVFAINRLNKKLAEQLSDVDNLYCVEISSDNNDSSLISIIIDNNFGRVFDCDWEDRLVAIPPYHILEQSYNRNGDFFYLQVLNLIKTVTLHVGGDCQTRCSSCSELFKQMTFCTKEGQIFSDSSLNNLRFKLNGLNKLERLNIILSSPDRQVIESAEQLMRDGVLNCFFISWKIVSEPIIKQITSSPFPLLVKILIDFTEITESQLSQFFRLQQTYKDSLVLVFCIKSESDLIRIKSKQRNEDLANCEIRCAYTGGSKEHLNQCYLLNDSDLLSLTANHNRIFQNRELNSDLFGQIVIHPDGSVRLNENTEIIGTVDDNWTEMLNKALNKPNPWLMTRKQTEPCSNCIYQDLCPPIRNLELYMGDKLACVDFYKSRLRPSDENN